MTDTQDVRIERVVDAPIDLVWAMWTDAEHFAGWYGPAGATIPRAELDVRVGGRRHIAMEVQTPGGLSQMDFVGEYLEVVPLARLVYTESLAGAEGSPTADTSVVVELTDLGARTGLVMTHVGVPADSPGGQGWASAIDAMERRVAELAGRTDTA